MHFEVYTKPGCPYCTRIKQVLESKSYSFTELELDKHFSRRDFARMFDTGSTFPQVIMDGKNLGGCTDTVKYLQEQNLL